VDQLGSVYAEGRRRVTDLVAALSPEEAATTVPTCPEWSVHDVVAHLAGSCRDVLAGRIDGITTAPWADAQVAQRSDRSMAELLEEWTAAAGRLEPVADLAADQMGVLWVLDLTSHEHDIRAALGRPGCRDGRGVDIALELLVGALDGQLKARGLGPLRVRTPDRTWVVGIDAAATSPQGGASLDAPAFELFRALTGRRSRAQLAGLAWSVDPGPYLDAFQFGTFTTSATDIHE
jgi:uncharacterized protein (TIGR03083 family)